MRNKEEIYKYLEEVPDPEIPVLSVLDLGVVRDVEIYSEDKVDVIITPTYSGCPAMNQFETDIIAKLNEYGIGDVEVKTIYEPAWTTDWITDEAKAKLEAYGIAPPQQKTTDKSFLIDGIAKNVICPLCKSTNTSMVSQFGSTACKALYRCEDCKEPFDYFKCI